MTAYKPDPAKLQGFLHTFLKHTPISRCFVKPQHCMRPVRNPFTKNKLFHCIYREKTQAVKNNSPHQLSKRSHFNTGYCKTPPPQHTIPDRRLNFFCNWIGSLAVRVKSSALSIWVSHNVTNLLPLLSTPPPPTHTPTHTPIHPPTHPNTHTNLHLTGIGTDRCVLYGIKTLRRQWKPLPTNYEKGPL